MKIFFERVYKRVTQDKKFFFYHGRFCFFLVFFVGNNFSRVKNIVFDLGGVLIYEDKMLIAQQLYNYSSLSTLLYFAFQTLYKGNEQMKKDFFDHIAYHTGKQIQKDEKPLVCDEKGNPLPELFCEWLRGDISCFDARSKVELSCDQSKRYDRVVSSIARVIFDPDIFISCCRPRLYVWNFLKEYLKEYNVYILSNMSSEMFHAMEESLFFKDLFNLLEKEKIFISAAHNTVKPDKECFNAFLKHYDLVSDESLFIDDQKVNIEAAKASGFHTILYNGKESLIKAKNFLSL